MSIYNRFSNGDSGPQVIGTGTPTVDLDIVEDENAGIMDSEGNIQERNPLSEEEQNAMRDAFVNNFDSYGDLTNFSDVNLKDWWSKIQDWRSGKDANGMDLKAYEKTLALKLGGYDKLEQLQNLLQTYAGQAGLTKEYGEGVRGASKYNYDPDEVLRVFNKNYQDYSAYLDPEYKKAQEEAKAKQQAESDSAMAAVQSAQSAGEQTMLANINAGIDKSKAGMLGDAAASTALQNSNIQSSEYAKNLQNRASTQADYLARQGQVEGLNQQAENMANSAGWATASGALSGMASGASTGFALSDERCKDGIDDNKLEEAITKFKELSERLNKLKGAK